MAVRKSSTNSLVLQGERENLLKRVINALDSGNFKDIKSNEATFKVTAKFNNFITVGNIEVILFPDKKNYTKIEYKSTANSDNLFALFVSPNKKIQEKFTTNL